MQQETMTETVVAQLKAIAFSDSIQQLTNSFTGRTWVLNKIDHWLQQKDQRFLLIAEEPGVGKSAIAAHLIQTRNDIIAYHFCRSQDAEEMKPGRILRSLSSSKQP